MDEDALNYNALATSQYLGCLEGVLQGNPDESCIPKVYGCTNSAALNYNSNANTDDGSCIAVVEGCIDQYAQNYNAKANKDDGSCIAHIMGCTDLAASNFEGDATINASSLSINGFWGNPCEYEFDFCVFNSNAINYEDPSTFEFHATYPGYTVDHNIGGVNYSWNAIVISENCISPVYGCMEVGACNYSDNANISDDSCEYTTCTGCTDPDAINYNANALIEDGSCEYPIEGCTDPNAVNYDPLATIEDDGSCIYENVDIVITEV